MEEEAHRGIWLEVAECRYGTGNAGGCEVQLRGDRERPAPVWWSVDPITAPNDPTDDPTKAQFETYKTIVEQLDKKRGVLARLSCNQGKGHSLRCSAFRFQTPELASR